REKRPFPGLSERASDLGFCLVGLAGFEPTTSASRTQRSTKLSHSPSPDDAIRWMSVGRLSGHLTAFLEVRLAFQEGLDRPSQTERFDRFDQPTVRVGVPGQEHI